MSVIKISSPSFFSRRLFSLIVGSFVCASPAFAGFLEDFYQSAGAQSNLSRSAILESQALTTMTGGSYVLRVPQKNFSPFYLEAPSLKAGCGGIDIFLGAFALPSREAFVSFLRSIGTAMPGLAFQLALQSLSPDLNQQVTEFRDLIREYSDKFSNSCRAAQSVLDTTGASAYLSGMQHRAVNFLRSSGKADDASAADEMTRTSTRTVLSNVPERKDTGGTTVEASEMNLTWALLKSSKSTLTQSELELMMTLTGTTLYRIKGTGDDTTLEAHDVAAKDVLEMLLGEATTPTLSAHALRYACDEPQRCLKLKEVAIDEPNLIYRLSEAANAYRQAILTRNPDTLKDEDVVLLQGISSLPLISLIASSANARFAVLSKEALNVWVEAAAYEAVIRVLESVAQQTAGMIGNASAGTANAINRAHAKRLEARTKSLIAELQGKESAILERMSRNAAVIEEIRLFESTLNGQRAAHLYEHIAPAH